LGDFKGEGKTLVWPNFLDQAVASWGRGILGWWDSTKTFNLLFCESGQLCCWTNSSPNKIH